MEAPHIFLEFCQFFHQDILIVYQSMDAILYDFFENRNVDEIAQLKAYLGARMQEQDIKSLQEEWYASSADVFMSDQDLLNLYQAVLDFEVD